MTLQKDSLPIVSGSYATAPHYRHHFHLLFWFFINMILVEEFLFSNITLKVLLNVDHLKTHNMRLKTVRQKSKLSSRSFRNEKTKQLEQKVFD